MDQDVGSSEKQWHVAQWSPMALVETAIELAAFVFSIVASTQALSEGTLSLPGGRIQISVETFTEPCRPVICLNQWGRQ